MKKILGIITIILMSNMAVAQDEEINVAGLVLLSYSNSLPEGLLNSKTAVLVSTPNKPGESIAEDWHVLAEEVHPVLIEGGMDPVAYYFYDDVYSGLEARAAFADSWKQRGISNILLLMKSELNAKKDNMQYLLLATAFNGEASLMTEGQPAWKSSGKNLKNVLQKYTRASNKLESNNLMPAPVPEYFQDVRMIEGNRIETYFTDLALGKLAVPQFGTNDEPGKRPGGLVNNLVENRLEQAEQQANQYNRELANIMADYKFEYGLVDPATSDADLMKEGYVYVIRSLHTSGIEIQRLLNYEVDEEDEYYITVKMISGKPAMRYIPIQAPVYKYYIKNLKTKNVYLGKNWDADETWQESLKNVLYNISQEIK